jgi:hypothetical protein
MRSFALIRFVSAIDPFTHGSVPHTALMTLAGVGRV